MITVKEADTLLFSNSPQKEITSRSLLAANNEVLAEDIFTDTPMPPFDRVAMDGIAIYFDDWKEKGHTTYKLTGIQAAGQAPLTYTDSGNAIEVMTGAHLPHGCDCVIPYEKITIDSGNATLTETSKLARFQNIHQKGSDYKKGTCVLQKNTLITSAQAAVLASLGKTPVSIIKRPKIAVISTGNELVDSHETPTFFQIRRSNSIALKTALTTLNYEATLFHFNDEKDTLIHKLTDLIHTYNVIILSGGVSKGKYDYIPEALAACGVDQQFHYVKQRPGKPFWFGAFRDQCYVFGLPGNPVSTQICFFRFVRPFLDQWVGKPKTPPTLVSLGEDISFKFNMRFFPLVNYDINTNRVYRVANNGSGDVVSIGLSDGFIELNEEKSDYRTGDTVPFYAWESQG